MKRNTKTKSIITIIAIISFITAILFSFMDICYSAESYINKPNLNDAVDVNTKEIVEAKKDNPYYIDETEIEQDAILEQENIKYDGDESGNGLSLLGPYHGLTYYSQADSRWGNDLYTATGNKTQTYKSSGCGPTAAAIIVSSAKGTILPTTMGQLFVKKGYRTRNSGTAWSAFPYIADYFQFKEYYSESSLDNALKYLKQKNSNGTSKYYVVCSVRKRAIY